MRAPLFAALLLCGCHSAAPSQLRGHVVVSGGGSGGVTVRAVGPTSASAATDASGSYVLTSLTAGDYDLVFTADDTLEKTKTARVHVAGATTTAPTVQLTGAGGVDGIVTISGSAATGATVFVEGGRAVATTDGSGHYHLSGVGAGDITIAAVLAGYRPGSVGPVAVARAQVASAPTLDLMPDDGTFIPATLAGKALRIDRTDHSGTKVTATLGTQTFTTTTAADGSYRIDGIPGGLYRLDFDYDGHHESLPQVLAQAGATGQIIDDALYPLADNPLELPIARRIADAGDVILVDGERALLLTANSDGMSHTLSLLTLSTGGVTVLATDAGALSSLTVTADRSRVLYLAAKTAALRIVGFDGSPPLTLAPTVSNSHYTLLPDDARVLYLVGSDVRIVATSGAPDTPVAGNVSTLQLDGAGTHLLYQSCTNSICNVWQQTIDGGAPVQVLSGASDWVALAHDGAHAATVQGYDGRSGNVLLGSAGSATVTVWQGEVAPYSLSYSRDGRLLFFMNMAGDLHAVDLKSATPTAVLVGANVGGNYVGDLVVTGDRMIYERDAVETGSAFIFTLGQKPVSGGDETTLGSRVTTFALSADAAHTVFVDNDDGSGFGRLRVADQSGTGTTLIAGGVAGGATFSRDGAHVLYEAQHPTRNDVLLFRSVPAAGGSTIDLGDLAIPPMVVASPGGGQVAFRGSDRIDRIVAPTGGTARAAGIGDVQWASDTRVVITLANQPAPFRHQDGTYVLELLP